jgi:hypothetical protein
MGYALVIALSTKAPKRRAEGSAVWTTPIGQRSGRSVRTCTSTSIRFEMSTDTWHDFVTTTHRSRLVTSGINRLVIFGGPISQRSTGRFWDNVDLSSSRGPFRG